MPCGLPDGGSRNQGQNPVEVRRRDQIHGSGCLPTFEARSMYQQEHDELFASIRAGKPINDGEWMTRSIW